MLDINEQLKETSALEVNGTKFAIQACKVRTTLKNPSTTQGFYILFKSYNRSLIKSSKNE